MTPRDLARLYVEKAREDQEALRVLVSDSIFGFHAQQAAEKYVKALLAVEQVKPERTHDLGVLLDELRALGHEVPEEFFAMRAWTPYAVMERYPLADLSPPRLSRVEVIELVERLGTWVEIRLEAP